MKKIFFFILIVNFFFAGISQQYIEVFANDTIKADTNYYPSDDDYPNIINPSYGIKAPITTGEFCFVFTHTDIADSLNAARIEGSNDATNWVALTGTAVLSMTTTDGTSSIYTSTPLVYLYYRAFLSCASGDTVKITNPTIIYKEK